MSTEVTSTLKLLVGNVVGIVATTTRATTTMGTMDPIFHHGVHHSLQISDNVLKKAKLSLEQWLLPFSDIKRAVFSWAKLLILAYLLCGPPVHCVYIIVHCL